MRPSQLVVRFDEVWSELYRLLEERLRILVHLAPEVHETEIEMRVERGLFVVIEPDGLGQMLDRLSEDFFLEADVPDIDARQRIRGLFHQYLLKGAQGIVVIFMQHLRPTEQRLCLRLPRGELQRPLQGRDGARMIAERDETPSFFDEGRRTDVIGVHRRPLAGELRRRRLLRVGGELFVTVDELANLVLQLRELAQHPVDFLEVGDDLPLRRLALGASGRALELARDGVVFASQHTDW